MNLPHHTHPDSAGTAARESDVDLTQGLQRLAEGADSGARALTPQVYDRLRRLAGSYLARERADHTLQPTALVHEAFLQLADQSRTDARGRAHFLALAAMSMRRILVDHARAKGAGKRQGGERMTLSGAAGDQDGLDADVLDLEEALVELAERSERQARIVEMRFFGGSTVEEIAHVLSFSTKTIKDDWRVARAWLRARLSREDVDA